MSSIPNEADGIEVRDVVVPLPVRDGEIVGATLRPPRSLTIGRRPSDRWLAWSLCGLIATMCLFALWTAYQLDRFRRRLDAVIIHNLQAGG